MKFELPKTPKIKLSKDKSWKKKVISDEDWLRSITPKDLDEYETPELPKTIEEEISNLLYHLHGYDKGEVALLDLQINDTVQSLLELIHQEQLKARLDEIMHCCEECGFWHDHEDKNTVSQTFNERKYELEQQLNKEIRIAMIEVTS